MAQLFERSWLEKRYSHEKELFLGDLLQLWEVNDDDDGDVDDDDKDNDDNDENDMMTINN